MQAQLLLSYLETKKTIFIFYKCFCFSYEISRSYAYLEEKNWMASFQVEYKRGVSCWNFDVESLKLQAAVVSLLRVSMYNLTVQSAYAVASPMFLGCLNPLLQGQIQG